MTMKGELLNSSCSSRSVIRRSVADFILDVLDHAHDGLFIAAAP